MLSGSIHRSATDALSAKVSTDSTRNVATEPISRNPGGFPVTRPPAIAATAITSATNPATAKGTLPTSTQ